MTAKESSVVVAFRVSKDLAAYIEYRAALARKTRTQWLVWLIENQKTKDDNGEVA